MRRLNHTWNKSRIFSLVTMIRVCKTIILIACSLHHKVCYAFISSSTNRPFSVPRIRNSVYSKQLSICTTLLPKNHRPGPFSTSISSDLLLNDDEYKKESPSHRMRRRKVKIYQKRKTINVAYLFALWYVLSVAYNIFSKKILIMAPEIAWTAAWAQMALGLLYIVPLWLSGMRKRPEISPSNLLRLTPVVLLHSLVHIGGVVSMGAGAVSFTYIVKASEPAVSAALSALVFKSFLPLPVYLSLFPVMAGVALSSISELTFNWKAFNYAMVSNLASAGRAIVGKKTLKRHVGKHMDAMNTYAVLTILSAILLLPVAYLLEGPLILPTVKSLYRTGKGPIYLLYTILAALCYYTYNEVSFICLDNVSPVSHALGNTLKRVFIIISSMLVFGNRMTSQGIFGSIMAIGGVLLYSLAKHHYKKKMAGQ